MDFDQVFKEELDLIRKKPGKKRVLKNRLVGLAISGGGIRAAAFGLGVIHGLVRTDKFREIDYLSTVSGGGFIGSALTWALYNNKKQGKKLLTSEGFPLGQIGVGARNSTINDTLNYIRQHANYLLPGRGLNLISLVAVGLRGFLLGVIAYFPLIALLLYFAEPWNLSNAYIVTSLGFGTLFAITSILFSLVTYFAYRFFVGRRDNFNSAALAYQFRTSCQKWMGRLLTGVLVFLLLWSLKPVSEFLGSHSLDTFVASGLTGFGYIIFVAGWLSKRIVTLCSIAGIFFVYGLLLLAYQVAEFHPTMMWYSVAASLIIGFFCNLNMVGHHRMYRDRLMETFLPDPEMVKSQQWGLAKKANIVPMHAMCDAKTPGPYHLSCTTVGMYNAFDYKVKGRGGDSFLLAPLHCGSFATGYQPTPQFMKGKLNLSSAMAISAAAANPNAAFSGIGPTRNPLIAFLMTLINLRLGYWTPNPNHQRAALKGWTPNFFFPGIQDLLGLGYNEKSPYVELMDGGIFENLGLYELIRRKMKIIISADSVGDLSDLANAIEKVRVDFGVTVDFDNKDFDLQWLLPISAEVTPFTTQYAIAKRGFAIGTIYYPDGEVGKMLYIQPVMTNNLSADLYALKSSTTFPNTSTIDQFFDESHFEGYRELGYQISKDLFSQLDDRWNLKKTP